MRFILVTILLLSFQQVTIANHYVTYENKTEIKETFQEEARRRTRKTSKGRKKKSRKGRDHNL